MKKMSVYARITKAANLLWYKYGLMMVKRITLADGHFQGYIPARYPLTPQATQETRLGSLTDWQPVSESLCIGLGRKMLITDNADYALPDLRELRFY